MRILADSIVVLLLSAMPLGAQTYTSPGSATFTNPNAWDFGAGTFGVWDIPVSDSALTLNFLTYGTSAQTATDDLNLTLNALNLGTFNTGGITLGTSLAGDFVFTGGVAKINLLGSGGTQISAPIVFGHGLGSLIFDGAGGGALQISGVISSNTAAGAPLIIATDATNPLAGIVRLQSANTFLGGVVLNSGTLGLTNARALGDRTNTLTVNGGALELVANIANDVILNSTVSMTSNGGNAGLFGVLSGVGGVDFRLPTSLTDGFLGINTYTGATTVGQTRLAVGTVSIPSTFRLSGAVGSINSTSAINLSDSMVFEINKSLGDSALNSRVNVATPINVTGGFVQVIGATGGLTNQALGTLTGRGHATILASASGTGTATNVTIANLVRSGGGTVVFSGQNLGNAATVAGTQQADIFLTQINSAAPSSALVGGNGAAGTTTISILPWALGGLLNSSANFSAGSGFVTYGANGLRVLDPNASEYALINSLTGTTDNVRIVSSATFSAPKTINSLLFGTNSTLNGGANTLTITSGALASTVANAFIDSPVNFGAGGAGEAIITVVGGQSSSNSLTLNGALTANTLTKSGGGILSLVSTANAFSGNLITVNAGSISVISLSRLGIANAGTSSIVLHGRGPNSGEGLWYANGAASPETLNVPLTIESGHGYVSLGNGGNLTLAGQISGAGGLGLQAATVVNSVLTISNAANNFTGGLRLAGTVASTVRFSTDGNLGAASGPIVFGTATGLTLRQLGTWTTTRQIAMGGVLGSTGSGGYDTNGFNSTWGGVITGSSNLFKIDSTASPGTWTITAADNPYTGTISLGTTAAQGGTLALSGAGSLNSASITFGQSAGPAGTYVLNLSGATDTDAIDGSPTPWRSLLALNTTNGFTQAHTVQLGNTAGAPVDLRVASGTFGQGTTSGTGVITGFGKLVKVGSGTLTLANGNTTTNSTFTGGVEIWGGTLVFTTDNQLGNSSNGITIKGGILNNTATGATGRSITLGATPQPILSGSSLVTLNNGFNVAASQTLTLNGSITGSGGFNMATGTGALVLGAASNNYAGDTQISAGTLAFTDNNQLGGSTSRIRLNGGTLSDTAASGTQTLNRTIITTANSTINANSGGTLELAGPILGTNTITRTGASALSISGDNSSFFGTLTIGTASSTTGTVALANSGQLRRATVGFAAVTSATFDMSGLSRETGNLTLLGGSTLALGAGGNIITGFNNGITTLGPGKITGDSAASFSKVGTGTMNITGNTSTFGGGFHVLTGAPLVNLSGNGGLPWQSAFTIGAWGSSGNRGPVMLLDNSSTDFGARLADSQVIHSNSASIIFTTNGTTASSETIGSLRGAGLTFITMTTGGTLNFADATDGLKRINNGSFVFRSGGTSAMGSGAAGTNLANVTFGNLGAGDLIGGGGAAGTTTISILPYAVGGATASDTGSNFVTYGANGIRVLNTTTEVSTQTNVAGIAGASSTNNVQFANSALTTTQITGGANLTVNSLSIAGTAGMTRVESAGTEKLVVTSGALLNTVANVWATETIAPFARGLGIQTAELQTGNGNARELNIFTTGDLAIGAKITTTGGLTKSGGADLYLTSTANTYSGATTINTGSLVIDNKTALGGSTTLQIGGGFLKYRGGDTTLGGIGIVAAGGEAGVNQMGGSAGFHVVSGSTLTTASGSVSGYGGVLKDGTGVLKLTGTNTYGGATIISGGALAIDGAAALGTSSRIIFADGISTSGGQTLRFDANNITLTQDIITNTSQAGIGIGFDTNGHNATLSGTILSTTSTRGLYKFGAGNLTLTATEMFTGSTQIFGGTLTLSGANGSILNSAGSVGFNTAATVLVNPGATLVLNNTAANNNNRLPDVWDSPFGTGNTASGKFMLNGGEFKLIGNSGGTQERINQFDISFGTVTLQNGGGGTQLVSGRLFRTGVQTSVLVRGDNLGGTPGPGSTNWFLTDLGSGSTQLGGAGGAEGTPFVNILPGFIGAASATGTGTDLMTYAADTGLRLLSPGEYTNTIPANNFDLNRAPNVALTGAASVNQTTAITALKLGPGATLGGSGTVYLAQSTVIATGSASLDVLMISGNISGGNGGYDLITSGSGTTLTVNSVIASGALTTYGEGTVQLNARTLFNNGVVIGQGTLKLGANGALSPLGTPVTVSKGATFDLNGGDRIISGLTAGHSQGVTTLVGSFNMGQVSEGIVALGANRLTIYDSATGTFTGNITGGGGIMKAFNSTGTSTFTQPQSYTGSTVIRAGAIQLASAGTLASSSIELRGGTLQFTNTDDNAAAGGYIANRIGPGVPVTWAGGGITFTENVNTPANHSLGAVTLAGGGTLTITSGSTAPGTTTIANLIRSGSNTGTLAMSATNLGLAQSPTGNARVFATQINSAAPAGTFIGGGGAVGTTTQNILPWAWSSTAVSFLTYGTDGFRPLSTTGEYATTLGANAADNVRTTAAVVLFAPTTANSLIHNSTGAISGAFDLTLTSGALAVTSDATIGVNTNALLTGTGNTRELVINTAAATTLNYNLTTSGGVTKFGSATLTLGGTNAFTGGLAINDGTVSFSNSSQLGTAGGAIRFGGSASSIASLAYIGSTNLVFNRSVETVSFGNFTGAANTRWQFNQPITGAGGVRFTMANAVFELNATNSYGGPTQLTSGHVFINNDASLGSGGEVLFSGGTLITRGDWTSSRLVHVTATGSSIVTDKGNTTWSGQFIGSSIFAKNGAGDLLMTEAMPFTSTLTVNAGSLVFKDRGSLAVGTVTASAGATVKLDDTAAHFSDRLSDTGTVTLNGGALNLTGSASATTEEVINALAFGAGANTVTVVPGSGQAAILRLVTGATNAPGAATLFRGANLGVNVPGTANSANIVLTDPASQNQVRSVNTAFTLTGGAAPSGHPSISIIRGAFGDTSSSGLGTQLVTYDLEKGVRLLDPATEYTPTLVNGSIVTDNVKIENTALALPNATTANALWLRNGGSITGGGQLSLTAGNLLATGSNNTIANPITAGSNALAIGGPGNVTLNGAVSGTGGVIKQGAGTLSLNAVSTYTGGTVLAAGVLEVGNAGALGSSDVQIQGGEIRNGTGAPLTLGNNLTLNGPMNVGGTQDLTFTGSTLINNATREINVSSPGVIVRLNGPVSASQSLVDYGLIKSGPGVLTLNGAQNYDVLTTNGGTTNLNAPLGTGQSIINANAVTNIGASQTLEELNIGPGAVVTLTATSSPFSDGDLWNSAPRDFIVGDPMPVVPEPSALALLCSAIALLARRPARRSARRDCVIPAGLP